MHEVMDAGSMPFFFHSLCSCSLKRASFFLQQLSLFFLQLPSINTISVEDV